MASRLRNTPLWLRLLLRRLRSPEGKLAPLALLSIAISVTLATGLEMGSRSAQRQLEVNAEAIRGSAEIEISAGQVGVTEEALEQVRATPGVRAASPLVSVKMTLADQAFALNLIGVDLVAEEQIRSTAIESNGLEIRDALRLLAIPNSVVVTEGLLVRLGLAEKYRDGAPAEFRVRAQGTEATLVVRGVLRPTGVAAAFSGQVALMDVYAAQLLSGRTGLFDRIDVVPTPGQDVASLIAALSARFEGVATVGRASGRSRAAEDLLQMVRQAALMLAGAAAFVACLLTYATTAQWVDRQRRQLSTLRAVGMEANRVQRLVFLEVSALAVVGTVLGTFGGIAVSPFILATLSKFLEVAAIEEITGVSVQVSTLWVAVVVGLGAGISGGVIPAYRAGHRFTLDSLAERDSPLLHVTPGFSLGVIALVLFVVTASMNASVVDGAAMLRVGLMFFLGSIAILAFSPTVQRTIRPALRPVQRMWPAIGHLATRFFYRRPWTFAVALTAISTLVGALVSIFLLIATVNDAVDQWTTTRYPAGAILINPAPFTAPFNNDLLSASTMSLIRTTRGVAAVDEQYRNLPTVIFQGRSIPLKAHSMGVVATRGHIPSVGLRSQDLALALQRGSIAVSTGFSKTFVVGSGDRIELDTPNGARSFAVAGVFEDFGDATGSLLLDLATYDSHWKRAGAWAATIWVDAPSEPVIAEIRRRVGTTQDLYFAYSDEIVAGNRSRTEVFTATLHVLGVFISSLGGVGVMILLAGIVAERRRDFAVLRASGAAPLQLVAVVVLDAIVLGLLGTVFGFALGFACAIPATDILRESFGWILQQRWFAPELPTIFVGGLGSAILGAVLPARLAFRISSNEVFGPE